MSFEPRLYIKYIKTYKTEKMLETNQLKLK